MDLLWLMLVVLAWLVLLKWVLPRFKLTGCGRACCRADASARDGPGSSAAPSATHPTSTPDPVARP